MSKAKVVFSNGSMALAHNLDDQYERWQEIQDAWEQMNEEMHQLTGRA